LTSKDLINLDVSFEWYISEEGKPRAENVEMLGDAPQEAQSSEPRDLGPPDKVHTGVIVRFDAKQKGGKEGYGFIKPTEINEDIFFLRSELPQELKDAQNKDEVINQHVEFKIKSMPDGKLRALSLELIEGGRIGAGPSLANEAGPSKKQKKTGSPARGHSPSRSCSRR
jgi:cold shock CspA family protein